MTTTPVDCEAEAISRLATKSGIADAETKVAVRWRTYVPWVLLAAMATLQGYVLLFFYAPASGGTDQNGYHVTAKLLKSAGRAYMEPESPFSFVGAMMVLTDEGRIYAKYPPGYPLLVLLAEVIGGTDAGYLVDPLCTVLACTLAFFLFRTVLSVFTSLLGVIWLMWNPLILQYANDANSHASALLCMIMGLWGLITWLQRKSLWPGVLGAAALGYAATIRYSEVLLCLPVLFAMVVKLLHANDRRRELFRVVRVGLAWALPVGALALFCWVSFGAPWKTGYSYCVEDVGFGWKYLFRDEAARRQGNWETLLVQMNWMGMLILWPLGVIGFGALIGRRWRIGGLVALATIPITFLYLLYYWAPNGETSLGYLRFYQSIIPILILCALWLCEQAINRAGRPALAVTLGLVTLLGTSVNLWNMLPSLHGGVEGRRNLVATKGFVEAKVPAGSAVFAGDHSFLNYADATGDYRLFDLTLFRNAGFKRFDTVMNDANRLYEPDPRQRARIEQYWRLIGRPDATGTMKARSNAELREDQSALIGKISLEARVFFLLRSGQNEDALPDPARWKAVKVAVHTSRVFSTAKERPIGGWNLNGRGDAGEPKTVRPVMWTLYEIKPVRQ
jgi:hypothetical protein